MAIPNNYIDKITKEGDSRPICPAADKVRVDNENFEADNLDDVLDELAGGKANKNETYTKEEVNDRVPLRIPATKNGDVITSATDYGEIANAVKEDWRDAYVVVNNESIFNFYQVEQNAIIFTRVDAEDGTQAYLAVSYNNVWSIEYSSISGGYEPPVGGIPKTDLAPGVQASLGKADTAVQDNDYTHTDNNYTDAEKTKLTGLPTNPVTSISVNGDTPQTPNNGNVNLVIEAGAQGPKGDKGDTVVIGDEEEFLIVNDLTTGGEADALSAEMGRRLAMLSGTFAEAWAHAQAIPYVFPWLWVETVNGDAICKPIWHRGSGNFVDAAGSPISVVVTASAGDPTISGTEGSSVPKDTIITITPASGCALHYSVDGGSTYKVADRAVNITLSTAGAKTIMAYCSNPNGSTTPVTRHITVQGTAVPTMPTSGEIARGGSVTISVPTGGELHYRINGGSWVTSANLSESITIANHLNQQEQMVIEAYNIVGGDQSDTVTGTYTMAALQAPTLTPAGGEVTSGSTVAITAPAGNIYYTTDGSDPTDQSTAYSSAIAITAGVTIKAIAKDTYGYSAVTSETYTVAVPKLKVKTRGATTMTLTKADDSTIELTLVDNTVTDNYNEFDIDTDLGGVTTFKSCAFGDKNALVELDFAGLTIGIVTQWLQNAGHLTKISNLNITGGAQSAFSGLIYLNSVSMGGTITETKGGMGLFSNASKYGKSMTLFDLSSLTLRDGGSVRVSDMFNGIYMSADGSTGTLDISSMDMSKSNDQASMFKNAKFNTLIVGNFCTRSGWDTDLFTGTTIQKVRITHNEPPKLSGSHPAGGTYTDWVASLLAANSNARIEVPSGSKATYVADSDWSQYENIIDEY